MYYVYDDESDAVQYNTPLLHRDICKWTVGEKDRDWDLYIYIYIFLNIEGALIVIQYLVFCWQIEPNSLERPDISQANQMLDIFIMAW